MLIDPLGPDDVSDRRKETYNQTEPADWPQFTADIERTLGLFDGYDRTCGNQWLADQKAAPSKRYHALAKMLADDRLWINSRSSECSQYLAVELAGLTNKSSLAGDCGGRTPLYNANAVFRSLLVRGTPTGVDDGLERDDGSPSTTIFPFLAAPSGPAETQGKYGLTTTGNQSRAFNDTYITTTGSIAVANLDHLIAQRPDEAGAEDLLLARSRFLGDYDALDRALTSAETRFKSGRDLLRRAAARSSVHRFAEALDDLAAAERAGADPGRIEDIRAAILVATGRAAEVVPKLEAALARRPTFAARSSLANAYAAVGRFNDADRMYEAALETLDTTSPFPYAWIYFARGLMWSEQAGDKVRGKAMYMHALEHLPEFAAANIHLAELETALGELEPAISRLERVVALSDEPEALALLGDLRVRTGDLTGGQSRIARASRIYDALLARHPLAFADHAAEFYLGPGGDAERAWQLAWQNLANRETRASFALAIRAARAAGRQSEVCTLTAKAQARFGKK